MAPTKSKTTASSSQARTRRIFTQWSKLDAVKHRGVQCIEGPRVALGPFTLPSALFRPTTLPERVSVSVILPPGCSLAAQLIFMVTTPATRPVSAYGKSSIATEDGSVMVSPSLILIVSPRLPGVAMRGRRLLRAGMECRHTPPEHWPQPP